MNKETGVVSSALRLITPRFVPPLEPEFRPAALANRAFRAEVAASGQGLPLIIGLVVPMVAATKNGIRPARRSSSI